MYARVEKTYGGEVSLDECLVLTTVTATPLFLSGISFLLPLLWLNVTVAGVALACSVHLLYSGKSRIMKIDENRAFMFAAGVIAWSYLVAFVHLP